jgi:hypothetical protein
VAKFSSSQVMFGHVNHDDVGMNTIKVNFYHTFTS